MTRLRYMESISSYVQTTPYGVRLGVIWLIQEIWTTGWLEIPLETDYERIKMNEDFLLQRFYFKPSSFYRIWWVGMHF